MEIRNMGRLIHPIIHPIISKDLPELLDHAAGHIIPTFRSFVFALGMYTLNHIELNMNRW
jgi:hypothetical protein